MDGSRRHRLLEKATRYEQVLITTTDLEQVNDFFGSGANYFHVSGGQVWPSDQEGKMGETPVSPAEVEEALEEKIAEASEAAGQAIDEMA
jgi:hypothetical protein